MSSLRIGQLNCHCDSNVPAELWREVVDRGLDAVLMQEPYSAGGRVLGFPLDARIVNERPNDGDRVWSAVLVANPRVDVVRVHADSHLVVVGLRLGSVEVLAVSLYCQYSLSIEPFLIGLAEVLRARPGGQFVIGTDANARSPRWYEDATNARGRAVEEFLEETGLALCNVPSAVRTHAGGHNLDLTFCTDGLADRVSGWSVSDSTSSDHRLITFEVLANSQLGRRPGGRRPLRYNLKKANWDAFRTNLWTRDGRTPVSDYTTTSDGINVENEAADLERSLREAASGAIPVRGWRENQHSPWWTAELSELRAKSNAARKCYQRERDPVIRERLMSAAGEARRVYTRARRSAQRSSLREFIRSSSEGGPWELWSKLLRRKLDHLRGSRVLPLPMAAPVGGGGGDPVVVAGEDRTSQLSAESAALRRTDDSSSIVRGPAPQLSLSAAPCLDSGVVREVGSGGFGLVETAARALLDTLVPSGTAVRIEFPTLPSRQGTCPFFTGVEVGLALFRLRTGKAPGPDGIPVEFLREAWKVIPDRFVDLFNACLSQGIFPKRWKTAEVVPILKSPSRDPSDLKAYRPISLLPTLGKWLERLMATRLESILVNVRNPSQYGFVPGKSTEDAINDMIRAVDDLRAGVGSPALKPMKYVVGLFLDISGAFDAVSWGQVIRALVSVNVDPWELKLWADYYSGRSAQLSVSSGNVRKELDQGTPQGSILGPVSWDLVFDEFLGLPWPRGVRKFAYADDVCILLSAATRRELRDLAVKVGRLVTQWGESAGLRFNPAKSESMIFVGKLTTGLSIPIGGSSVTTKDSVKYLGVTIDRGRTFAEHARIVRDKARASYSGLVPAVRARWGVRYEVAKSIYQGIVESVVCYAASVFAGRTDRPVVRRRLRSAQHPALVALCKAYRTTATLSLCLLAGVMPLDYLVVERAALYRLRKGETVTVGNTEFHAGGRKVGERLKTRVRQEVLRMWEDEWRTADVGRPLYQFMPKVASRMSNKWLVPNAYLTRLVTGHGPYVDYFERFNIEPLERPICKCGQPRENSSHVLDGECQLLSEPYLAELAGLLGRPPTSRSDWFATEATYRLLSELARESLAHEAPGESTRESRERTLRE